MGTHDFIEFPPTLGKFSPRTWLLLGEIQAKIQYIKQLPVPPDDSRLLLGIYVTKGVHGTTAIEGNTLSEEQIGGILMHEERVPRSRQYQEQQVIGIGAAFEEVARDAAAESTKAFSVDLLNRYHRFVLLTPEATQEESVIIGELRTDKRVVGHQYSAAPPEDCERLVNEFCDWLNNDNVVPEGFEDYDISWQVVKALVAHVYFAWIHPYGDGNGRMARLIEFAILLRAGVPHVAAHLLSNFYNATRDRYSRELNETHGPFIDGSYPRNGRIEGFIEYALQGFSDGLDEQFGRVVYFQQTVVWRDYIHSCFPRRLTPSQQRRRRVALDLMEHHATDSLSLAQIREMTPAVAALYASKTDRTIRRDLEKLIEMALVKKDANGYSANLRVLVLFSAKLQELVGERINRYWVSPQL